MLLSDLVLCFGTIFLLSLINNSKEYSIGAPVDACEDMVPQHNTSPSNSLSTYYVATNKMTLKAGEQIAVHVGSINKEHTFKGFFVQARDVDFDHIGSFLPADDIKLVSCGTGVNNAVTHVNNQLKKKVALTWLAPNETIKGPISFQLTLVQDYNKYWIGLKSEELIVL